MHRNPPLVLAIITALSLAPAVTHSQEATCELGSPTATSTITGRQLPPPNEKFAGVIKENALEPGKHTLQFDFKYDGLGFATLAFNNVSGVGHGGTGVLTVDGKEAASHRLERTIPFLLPLDESFDIGEDTLTSVDEENYQPPFKLTAKLDKLTISLDRLQLTPEDVQKLKEAEAAAADAK